MQTSPPSHKTPHSPSKPASTLSSQHRRLISQENRINSRLIIRNNIPQRADGRSTRRCFGDISKVNINGLRKGDTATNRRVDLVFKESDVFGGCEGGRERIGTPYARSVLWSLKEVAVR